MVIIMNWFKISQQGLLFYPWKKASEDSSEKVRPIGSDPETGENIYQCNLCGKNVAESAAEWYLDPEKKSPYTLPTYSAERISAGINEIVQYLRPFLKQLDEYLKTSVPAIPEETPDTGHWWNHNTRLRSWEVQIPLIPQIFEKYPELSDICNLGRGQFAARICDLQRGTEINGEDLDRLSAFINNPSLTIQEFSQYSKKQIDINLKVPLCEECQEELVKCNFCDKKILPGENKYPTVFDEGEFACENCIESGRADLCQECGKADYSDEMMYSEGDGNFCKNCYQNKSGDSMKWAEEALSNINIPVGKNLPISEKVISNLHGFISKYISKYNNKNSENVQLFQEWERMSHLSTKSGLNQGAIEYLNYIYNTDPHITLDKLEQDLDNNLSAQKYMREQYPNLNYQDMMYDVEIVESYNKNIPGFTLTIKPSKAFFNYARKKYPHVEDIWSTMKQTPHHPGYLAYARCAYDGGNNIVVNNLQRDADFDNWESKNRYPYTGYKEPSKKPNEDEKTNTARWLDQMTKHWDVFLLNLLKAMGIAEDKSVFLTTFNQQKRKWSNLPIHKSKRTYEEVPEKMGFPKVKDQDVSNLIEDGGAGHVYQVAMDLGRNWYKKAQNKYRTIDQKSLEKLYYQCSNCIDTIDNINRIFPNSKFSCTAEDVDKLLKIGPKISFIVFWETIKNMKNNLIYFMDRERPLVSNGIEITGYIQSHGYDTEEYGQFKTQVPNLYRLNIDKKPIPVERTDEIISIGMSSDGGENLSYRIQQNTMRIINYQMTEIKYRSHPLINDVLASLQRPYGLRIT